MRSSLRSFDFIFVLFLFAIGVITLLVVTTDTVEAGSLSSDLDDDEFEVDNSDGLTAGSFEPLLTITNDGDPVNVTITMGEPTGEDTGRTKNVYPHIFSDNGRRKDKGSSYYVELDNGDNKFYPLISVNDSTFADTYTFEIKVSSKTGEFADDLVVTVVVTPYNNIFIELPPTEEKDPDEKTVTAGKTTVLSVLLMNRGNIYQEEVGVEIFDGDGDNLPLNLTLIEIQYPGDRTYINPELFEIDVDIIIDIKIEADSESGPGKFEVLVFSATPENEDAVEHSVGFEIEIVKAGTGKPEENVIDEGGEFPVAIFGGGLALILVVMVGAFYFLVLNKDEETEGWGEGEGEAWGANEWGDDAEFDSGGAPEEYEAPITSAPRPAPARAGPKPRAVAPAPGPKPSGPAHVKCPKCKTGVKVSNPKRPLTIGCPKCSTKFTLKGKPGGVQAPARAGPRPAGPKPAGPVHVKCPKCHTGVKVSNPKRPLTIGCPKCSTKFTLKGKPGGAPGPARAGPRPAGPKPAGPAHVKCPKCHTGVKVSNPKRPLTIGCPKCSTKFTLKGKPGGAPGPGPRPGGAKPKGPALISCPKCSTKFKVSNPKRPLKVACPKCKTGLNLK